MNKLHFLTGPLLLGALLATGSVQAQVPGVSLEELIRTQGSISVGDKTFDQWSLNYNLSTLDLGNVLVSGIGDGTAGNEYGLSFDLTSPLTATGDDFADLFFGFRATSSAGWLIDGVSLDLTGGSLFVSDNNSGIAVWEYVGTSAADVADQLGSHIAELSTEFVWAADDQGVFGLNESLHASALFGPRSEVFIGKNLYAFATADGDSAELSSFTQRFHQTNDVPEPETLLLLGLGMMGLFAEKLRRNGRQA